MSGFMQYYRSLPAEAKIETAYFNGLLTFEQFSNKIRYAESVSLRQTLFSPRSIRIAWNIFLFNHLNSQSNFCLITQHEFQTSFGYSLFDFKRRTSLVSEVRKILMHFNQHARIIFEGSGPSLHLKIKKIPSNNCFCLTSRLALYAMFRNVHTGWAINVFQPEVQMNPIQRIEIPKFFKNPFQGLNCEAVLALTE